MTGCGDLTRIIARNIAFAKAWIEEHGVPRLFDCLEWSKEELFAWMITLNLSTWWKFNWLRDNSKAAFVEDFFRATTDNQADVVKDQGFSAGPEVATIVNSMRELKSNLFFLFLY